MSRPRRPHFSLCTLLCLWSAFAMAVSADVPFQTLEKGTSSGFEDELYRVYRTRRDFAELWRAHASNRHPAPPLPDVDLDARMVAVVFAGQRGSGGHGVEVTSVVRGEAGGLTVNYETSAPPPGVAATMALTEPFHMISLDASSGGDVAFEGSVRPRPPPPAPAFILGFEKGADMDAVARRIEEHSAYTEEKPIRRFTGFLTVQFDSQKISKDEFQQFLQNLDGVKYVEEDVAF